MEKFFFSVEKRGGQWFRANASVRIYSIYLNYWAQIMVD